MKQKAVPLLLIVFFAWSMDSQQTTPTLDSTVQIPAFSVAVTLTKKAESRFQ